jgi:hypothetical protein
VYAYKTVTVAVSTDMLYIECDDGPRAVRRTITQPITRIKVQTPPQGHYN